MIFKKRRIDFNKDYMITWKHLFVFPFAWISGLISLIFFGFILSEKFAFISSIFGAALGITILWFFLIKPYDNKIPLWLMIGIFALKNLFIYIIWSNYMFSPCGSEDLILRWKGSSWSEHYHYWLLIKELKKWWSINGFSLLFPLDLLNINHPRALSLVALPFASLPIYAEVLIPWHSFYFTATACSVFLISKLEGFRKNVSRAAFYLVLFQPYAWNVMGPLRRDPQCQMFFGLFILALLIFRRKATFLLAVAILGGWFLSLYRAIYGTILAFMSALVFITKGRRMITKQVLFKGLFVFFLVATTILLFNNSVITEQYIKGPFDKYGLFNIEVVHAKAYQSGLLQSNSWIATLPSRLLLGLMAPFPWMMVFHCRNFFEVSWQVANFLQTSLALVCFITIFIFGIKDLKHKKALPISVMFSLIIAVSGMLGYAVQYVYVQIAILFSFPYVLDKLGKKGTLNGLFLSILFFLISSVFWYHIR